MDKRIEKYLYTNIITNSIIYNQTESELMSRRRVIIHTIKVYERHTSLCNFSSFRVDA